MRINCILIFCIFSAFGNLSGQDYYVIPQSGNNPANSAGMILNAEYDDGVEGWNVVLDSVNTSALSKTQKLPFAFTFAGIPMSAFKVSSTGFLTFDTSVSGSPAQEIANIPSNKLPNNSIAIWGLSGAGSNDVILSKTFGTAPNRQFWIKFASYSNPKDSQGAWLYWSMVLQETTNDIFMVGMYMNQAAGIFKSPELVLGVQENSSIGWMFDPLKTKNFATNSNAASDNYYYQFIHGNQVQDDAAIVNVTVPNVAKALSAIPVSIEVQNRGAKKIDSFEMHYSVNGGSTVTEKIKSISIASGDIRVFSFSNLPIAGAAGIESIIKVWVSNPNGILDLNNVNDSAFAENLAVKMQYVKRNVLLEMGTASWCELCPAADRIATDLRAIHGDSLIIAKHHSIDEMAANGDSLNRAFYANLPGSTLNRHWWSNSNSFAVHRDSLSKLLVQLYPSYSPATVVVKNVNLDTTSKIFSFQVKVSFVDYCPGNIHVGGMALEDGVRGTGAGFSQKVSSSLTGNINNYFYRFKSPVIGYYHEQTVWNMPGSILGVAPAVKKNIYAPGDTVVVNFSYKYPQLLYKETLLGSPFLPIGDIISRFKPADMSAIGYVALGQNHAFPEILNAAESQLWDLFAGVQVPKNTAVILYPNPALGVVNVSAKTAIKTIRIVNLQGQTVYTLQNAVPSMFCSIDLISANIFQGLYILSATDNFGNTLNSQLVVGK